MLTTDIVGGTSFYNSSHSTLLSCHQKLFVAGDAQLPPADVHTLRLRQPPPRPRHRSLRPPRQRAGVTQTKNQEDLP